MLEREAPDFLAAVTKLELPASHDRLNVPVINTAEKEATAAMNMSEVERFIAEQCHKVLGESIKFGLFYDRFSAWLDPNDVISWSKVKVGRELPPEHPRGRATWDTGQFHIGNLSFEPVEQTKGRLVLRDGMLRHMVDEA